MNAICEIKKNITNIWRCAHIRFAAAYCRMPKESRPSDAARECRQLRTNATRHKPAQVKSDGLTGTKPIDLEPASVSETWPLGCTRPRPLYPKLPIGKGSPLLLCAVFVRRDEEYLVRILEDPNPDSKWKKRQFVWATVESGAEITAATFSTGRVTMRAANSTATGVMTLVSGAQIGFQRLAKCGQLQLVHVTETCGLDGAWTAPGEVLWIPTRAPPLQAS